MTATPAQSSATLTPFVANNTGAWRKLGLAGEYLWTWFLPAVPGMAVLGGGELVLRGQESGELRFPLAEIARLRAGFADTERGRYYELHLWTVHMDKPLMLAVLPQGWPAYAAQMRALAAAFDRHGRLRDFQGGTSIGWALLLPVLFGLLALATVSLSLFVLTREPWYGRLIVPSIPVLLFGLTLMATISRGWPRPLEAVEEIEGQLPPDGTQPDGARGKLWFLFGGRRKPK